MIGTLAIAISTFVLGFVLRLLIHGDTAQEIKMSKVPAPRPCESCPYRKDCPSGLWASSEYEKLPAYDGDTGEQAMAGATGMFYCHQQNGKLCAGWVACHDMYHSLSLRLAFSNGHLSVEEAKSIHVYTTSVPVFATGTEAALHGLEGVEDPDDDARRMIEKLVRQQARRQP